MRNRTDRARLDRFLAELGRRLRGSATVYLVGGASAVIEGWRATTIDIDFYAEPDDEVLRLVADLKDDLRLNIEPASPLDFLPELAGWRDRSPFVAQHGQLVVRQFDYYSQALAKLERGIGSDRGDVQAMLKRGLVEPSRLQELFAEIKDQLYRFPTVDPEALELAVIELGHPGRQV